MRTHFKEKVCNLLTIKKGITVWVECGGTWTKLNQLNQEKRKIHNKPYHIACFFQLLCFLFSLVKLGIEPVVLHKLDKSHVTFFPCIRKLFFIYIYLFFFFLVLQKNTKSIKWFSLKELTCCSYECCNIGQQHQAVYSCVCY